MVIKVGTITILIYIYIILYIQYYLIKILHILSAENLSVNYYNETCHCLEEKVVSWSGVG